jgi:ketosteroid isomerase-like protein
VPADSTQLIRDFYAAFARRDAAAMARCYHPEIEFSDDVFPDLRGPAAPAMWRMLCQRATDLRIEVFEVEAGDRTGRAHWEAWYTVAATGRRVHNRIDARFEFKDGLIVRHRDRFDFWRWARQALGPAGWFLGWSHFMQKRVQDQAARGLEKFLQRESV